MSENSRQKIIRPGRIVNYAGGRNHPDIFCKVEINGGRLSISGVIGPRSSGNCAGGSGQIDSEFAHRNHLHDDPRTSDPIQPEMIDFAEGWDKDRWFAFLEVWEVYHLNDLQAGCQHQRAFGWDKETIDPTQPATAYGRFYPGQSMDSWNLKQWARPPYGYLTKPCPICGYKYGTAWLKEDVPEDVIAWLFDLPDADRAPAWV